MIPLSEPLVLLVDAERKFPHCNQVPILPKTPLLPPMKKVMKNLAVLKRDPKKKQRARVVKEKVGAKEKKEKMMQMMLMMMSTPINRM